MRKFLLIAAVALLGTLGLGACNNNQQATTTTEAKVTKPDCSSDAPECMKSWQEYLSQIVQDNMGDVTNNPYVYFVPAVGPKLAAAVAADGTAPTPAGTNGGGTAPTLAGSGTGPKPAGTAAMPATASSAAEALGRVQDQLDTVVAATVLPGNMIAAGGPDSATTAQVMESAFNQASPGSFKGVVVLFIGDKADEPAVKAAVEPSGATFRFAQM